MNTARDARRHAGKDATARPNDDKALFLDAIRGATPIASPKRVLPSTRPPPIPVQSLLDSHDALAESFSGAVSAEQSMESGEELVYLRAGLPREILRKLRRGHWVTQSELDLHGMTQAEARSMLGEFLAECGRRHLRCVRIVHGKGLRSPNREPVLKSRLPLWLTRRNDILAYCQAPHHLGGSGALLVLLTP